MASTSNSSSPLPSEAGKILEDLASDSSKRRELALKAITERQLADLQIRNRVAVLARTDPVPYVREAALNALTQYSIPLPEISVAEGSIPLPDPDPDYWVRPFLLGLGALIVVSLAIYFITGKCMAPQGCSVEEVVPWQTLWCVAAVCIVIVAAIAIGRSANKRRLILEERQAKSHRESEVAQAIADDLTKG